MRPTVRLMRFWITSADIMFSSPVHGGGRPKHWRGISLVLPLARLLPGPLRLKIIDVGAALSPSGVAYSNLLRAFPCEVVGFEPIESECARLNKLALPGHRYLPYAIADGTRHTFYKCLSSECSSIFEPDFE